jgi:hypothetical protein
VAPHLAASPVVPGADTFEVLRLIKGTGEVEKNIE